MSRPSPRCRLFAATIATLLALPVHAQMVTFKNFKRYPAGQWQQELVGYRDNKPLGPPVISTTCSNPLEAKVSPAIAEAMKAAGSTCTTKTLVDSEQLLEFENVCKLPSGVQTLHAQVRAVDDRTMSMDMRSTMPGQPESLMKSKVTYMGTCSASAAAAANKPSAADCADMAKMRQDNEAAGGAAQCAQMPAPYRAQCEARMVTGTKMMAALEAQCK